MPATVEEIEIRFGTNAEATERAVDSLKKRIEEVKRQSSKRADIGADDYSRQIDSIKTRISSLKEARADAFKTILSRDSSWKEVDDADNKIRRLNASISDAKSRVRQLQFRDLADDMVDTSTKADILRNKIEGLSDKLANGLNTGKMDDAQIARSVEQLQKYKAALQAIEDGSSDTSNTVKSMRRDIDESGSSAERASSGFSKFGNTLKRLIVYRALRGIISGIANAAREGYQNLIQYSNGIRSADSAQAAATANAYATSLNQVKNSCAAAAAPIVQALLPAIQTVAGWFIAAANAVNMFISALQGKSSYTRALGVAVDYAGGLEDNLSGAGSAAKELKRTLLSFDEINALDDLSGGGGGGGGGAGGAGGGVSASDMFEEAEIDSKISEIAENVREVFETIRKYAEPVLNWIRENVDETTLIIAGLAGAIAALGGNFNVGVGIALSIVGLSMEYDAIKKIASGNGELKDYIKAAIGAALGVAGALLVFGTGPLGWTIGLGAVLTIGIVAALDGSGKLAEIKNDLKETADYYQRLNDIIANSEGIEQNTIDVLDRIRNAWDGVKSSADNAALSQMYALQAEAILNAQAAVTQYDKALQEQKKAYDHLQEVQGRQPTLVRNAEKAYREATEAVNVAEEALRNADVAVTESSNNIDKMRKAVEENSKTWDSFVVNADGSATLVSDAYKNIQQEAMETSNATKKMRDEAKRHLENFQSDVNYTKQRYSDFQKEVDTKSGIIAKTLEKVRNNVKLTKDEIDKLIKSIKQNAQLDIKVRASGASGQNTEQKFAEGGFPKAGSFFWAGENNVPELMGTIGGRTAVASGREITGITAAVNESSAREALLLNKLIEAVLSTGGDDGNGGITTTELLSAMKRQNRRDGATTFAV